jgi:MHS family alpha-ketoglutarate permease-like MFS transporter
MRRCLFAAGFTVRPLGGHVSATPRSSRRRGALMLSVGCDVFRLADDRGDAHLRVDLARRAGPASALARIVQGPSPGGEYGTSATHLTEMADQRHRGFTELPVRDPDRRADLARSRCC